VTGVTDTLSCLLLKDFGSGAFAFQPGDYGRSIDSNLPLLLIYLTTNDDQIGFK